MPPLILPAAPCCPSCQNLANQRKPETIANVNKHVKGTMLSDTLRKTGILADKNYSSSDRVCLPSATKIRKFSEEFYLIVSTLKADWPKGRGHKRRPKGQANLADCSAYATKLLDIKNVEKLTQSGQGKKSSARKSEGSQFCSRVSENKDAILNIDNVVSLEHSTRVKFFMNE